MTRTLIKVHPTKTNTCLYLLSGVCKVTEMSLYICYVKSKTDTVEGFTTIVCLTFYAVEMLKESIRRTGLLRMRILKWKSDPFRLGTRSRTWNTPEYIVCFCVSNVNNLLHYNIVEHGQSDNVTSTFYCLQPLLHFSWEPMTTTFTFNHLSNTFYYNSKDFNNFYLNGILDR